MRSTRTMSVRSVRVARNQQAAPRSAENCGLQHASTSSLAPVQPPCRAPPTLLIKILWQRGMSRAVCFAPMMPASCATVRTSPLPTCQSVCCSGSRRRDKTATPTVSRACQWGATEAIRLQDLTAAAQSAYCPLAAWQSRGALINSQPAGTSQTATGQASWPA